MLARREHEDTYRQRMRELELFSGCSDDEIDLLDQMLTEVQVPAGRELLHQGAVGRQFVVIIEGTAAVTRAGEELVRLPPGAFFGELSLLEGELRSASVISLTPMRLYVFDRGQFHLALDRLPSVAQQVRSVGRVRAAANRADGSATDGA